jgi:hypothetical protein
VRPIDVVEEGVADGALVIQGVAHSRQWTRVRPIMNEILQRKGLVEVAEGKVQVTDIKGPLEEGWQRKVEAFAARIPVQG